MRPFSHDTIDRDRRSPLLLHGSAVGIVGIFLLWICSLLLPESASATIIYSYIDERGTAVMTDNYETIPERYRAKVQAMEQAPQRAPDHSAAIKLQHKVAGWASNAGTGGGLDRFTQNVSGLTPYQSHLLNFGGIGAAICFLVRLFMRGQVIRFLALWCLIMLVLVVPALLFTSQDAPLDRVRGQAAKIQDKQQEHLQRTP
jgi:hypothetical protein